MSQKIIQGFPLSPQQKHLWLLQSDNHSQTDWAVATFLLEGHLEVEILETALNIVFNRHEILRTTFKCLPGMTVPVQVIGDRVSVVINQDDLSDLDSQKQQLELEAWLQKQQTDNGTEEQILSVSLVTLSPHKYRLAIALPTLCTDAKSLKNLMAEISQTYAACVDGQELADEPIQYILVSQWQNELLKAEEAEIGRDYWRKQDIARFLPLQLPFERQSTQNYAFKPQILSFSIPSSLVNQLDALEQKYGFCESKFLLSCWYLLLFRLIGDADLAVAISCDGRPDEELDNILGLFAKYLPINLDLDSELKFNTFLERVQLAQQEAYEWQECFSWEDVLAANENVQYPLFFPFAFDFEVESSALVTNKLSFSIDKQSAYCDRFKVKLSVLRRQDELLLEFHYDANLFTAEDIETLAARLQILLGNAVTNPEAPLGELEILSLQEKKQILLEWNNTQAEYPQYKCLHELFEEQVEKTPDAVAVVWSKQELTYVELNRRANQLAHYLQTLGVGAEVLVGICLERSPQMLVAILAILKAGGAYVPIDPAYPETRLSFMLEDASVKVLLTQQKLLAQLPTDNTPTFCLDSDWSQVTVLPTHNPPTEVQPDNLAYVIYTSGSTGKPKGTMILHRGVVNYLTWATQYYAVAEGNGAPVQSSIGFDATITSLFSPLLVGQKVVMLPETEEIEALAELLQSESNYSLVKITPAHLQMLSQLLPPECDANQTRALVIGGEALLASHLDFWHQYAPQTRIINEYGPTETVVGCCIYELDDQHSATGSIPIGRPIANTQLYILDSWGRPVPVGVTGELYIGGAGVARGYLNRPQLTTEKFIDNPFVGAISQSPRLYKTGDLARYLADGKIEYLGRKDNQVKIRGLRIELGEIEQALSEYEDVQETVVIVREDSPGDKRLVAYLVMKDKQVTADELRRFLQPRLPAHMVPYAFVLLNSLPITANGKVDRPSLPQPDLAHNILNLDFVAPRDTLELQLAQIWKNVLNIHQVGIQDNFFHLGGHSLLAVRLMAQIQQQFQKHLSLATLFQSPTIAQLAELLRQDNDNLPWSSLVPIQPNGSKLPFFCVPGSGGNTIYLHDLARYLAPDRPFYGLQSVGLDGKSPPHTTIEAMAAHYIQLIRTVQPHGPYFLGGHSLGGQVAFEMAQQLQQQSEEVALLAIFDTVAPIESNPIVSKTWNSATWLIHLAGVVEGLFAKKLVLSEEILQKFNPEEQLQYFKQQLESVQLLPLGSGIDQVRGLVEVFKANHQIQYQPQSTYPTQIALFRANEFEQPDQMTQCSSWDWEKLAVKPIETYTIPGNHLTIMRDPYVKVLAEKLTAAIAKVQMEVAA